MVTSTATEGIDMKSPLTLAAACLAAVSALANVATAQQATSPPAPLPGHSATGEAARAKTAPLVYGRWVIANSSSPPSVAELRTICSKPSIYLDISPTQIREVSPDHNSVCDMPKWVQQQPGAFIGKVTKCTPKPEPGEDEVGIEIKATGFIFFNNTPFALCAAPQLPGGKASP